MSGPKKKKRGMSCLMKLILTLCAALLFVVGGLALAQYWKDSGGVNFGDVLDKLAPNSDNNTTFSTEDGTNFMVDDSGQELPDFNMDFPTAGSGASGLTLPDPGTYSGGNNGTGGYAGGGVGTTTNTTDPAATPTNIPDPECSRTDAVLYEVKEGDNIGTIAAAHCVSVSQILNGPGNTNSCQLWVGTSIYIPVPVTTNIPVITSADCSEVTETDGSGRGAGEVMTPTQVPATNNIIGCERTGTTTYSVQPGEGLWIITNGFCVTVADILNANPGLGTCYPPAWYVLNIPPAHEQQPAFDDYNCPSYVAEQEAANNTDNNTTNFLASDDFHLKTGVCSTELIQQGAYKTDYCTSDWYLVQLAVYCASAGWTSSAECTRVNPTSDGTGR